MASKKQKAREYLAATHGDDRGGFALKAAAEKGRSMEAKKSSPSPTRTSSAGSSTGAVKRSGSAPAGRTRRPEKDDVVSTPKPAPFSTGPSTRGGARRTKTSTGPSTRGGARKSSVGTAGGGSSSRAGKRPEGGLIAKIRKTLSDNTPGGFLKKYRKK